MMGGQGQGGGNMDLEVTGQGRGGDNTGDDTGVTMIHNQLSGSTVDV